jgi:hypothetical protein
MAETVCSAEIAISGALEEDEDAGDCVVTFLAPSAVPQSPQKRLPGGFSAPHCGHGLVNGAPQSPQNLFSAGLSLPQFEQRIGSPGVGAKRCGIILVEDASAVLELSFENADITACYAD